ncbi:oxidoreductase [Mesorhizobium sp. M1C.F.Ca.ET.193.01.1.1]|uniref:PDR/VanB family oxidoreductase n=1 Tax=unclassified Mesorhizobium TaxID=325217 RepID=UPI000FD41C0C|nr:MULTISPECIES: PDR/VanB family oxidoreductase [unclassified Mesorhizobium]TGS91353.1 oxidoreductase [bacterium M00.F.Ca.ET.177.01.1.1]RWJ96288.1 MAG: oxidoreductase [Mesorhizobium sp.]TGQ49738.1 oxidoreductase [Mesorhizobium sp. M1C.F.Ca.ET.210.01.1.1]TGQ63986.1 oxidoreductase [Mesorhizobium sp. M1C.F.Ca.ET.212.01.1.1]TGQ97875.1 oxidoreductase [Mesorhizobium sp. M1C.F.Ca.ET.204.01.1.1]
MSAGAAKIPVRVAEVTPVNELVTRFRFVRRDGGLMPTFSGGAHTVVEMNDQDRVRRNPYSIMSDPGDREGYSISIRRDDNGRGGSLFMHRQVRPGMEMVISNPVNLFALDLRARKHLLLAGGIGITPFLAQIKQLSAMNGNFELHYSVRTASLGSYADELVANYRPRVHLYHDDRGEQIDLPALLDGQPLGTHVYVCGPKGMIAWVRKTATALGWPREAVHHEEFLAPASGKPFEVMLARSNKTIQVGEHQSLLEAIEAAGVEAPYLCRGGACGQCETDVLEYEGTFLHKDHWLTPAQCAGGTKIMPCVSRFEGKTLVLDR